MLDQGDYTELYVTLLSLQGEMAATPAGFAHLTHLLMGLAGGKLILSLEVSNSLLPNAGLRIFVCVYLVCVRVRVHSMHMVRRQHVGLALPFHGVDSFEGLKSGLLARPLMLRSISLAT